MALLAGALAGVDVGAFIDNRFGAEAVASAR
jgi:hypothetical protein